MARSRLLVLTLTGVVDVCRSVTIFANGRRSNLLTPAWAENASSVLRVNDVDNDYFASRTSDPTNSHSTVVVTFAGKKNMEYIDGAVLLGASVQEHLPTYPMAAIIIEGMKLENQQLLQRAGWKLITVPNWEGEYCGDGCDFEFLGRWHDSFEKINVFRLPFKRVLFMDSDTYIFRSHVKWLVTQLKLPSEDHIAMAKDGCKNEFNSGVMIFKPDINVFQSMLTMVSQRQREQILDQNLINSYYSGKIFEFDRMFNCVDTVGIQPGQTKPCEHHCSWNAVVAHFTGHPKPTSAKKKLLELVRRPEAPQLACMHTNFGSCSKWSEYYCDIRKYSHRLSRELQSVLGGMGRCCHVSMVSRKEKKWARKMGKFRDETCEECPATLKLWAPNPNLTMIAGAYMKTTIPSRKFNGGRPIYINRDRDMKNNPVYMFFLEEQLAWAIGSNYKESTVYGYSGKEAQCPRDTGLWFFHNGTGYERKKLNIRRAHNWRHAPKDTEHIVWNIHRRKWYREKMFWEHGHLNALSDGDDALGGDENDTNVSGEEEENATEENATENEETDAENDTTDSAEEDEKFATESENADESENEATQSGEEGGKKVYTDLERLKDHAGNESTGGKDPAQELEAEKAILMKRLKALEDDKKATESKDTGAAEKETTEGGEKGEKNASQVKGDEASSDGEQNGVQLVPFVLQSCIQMFKRVLRW